MARFKKPRKKPKVREDVMLHAQKRAKERWGLELKQHDFDLLHGKIWRNDYLDSRKQSGSRTLFFIMYGDILLPCIYDKNVSHISTFLPKDAREFTWRRFKHLQNTQLDN
jgi:hypothetical protein